MNDAFMKPATLTFARMCACGSDLCVDCRSWVAESDIPLHPGGPILPAMAGTVGVDQVRLVNHRYTVVVIVAKAFEVPVVLQSIKENVAAVGPVNCFTGTAEMKRPETPPGQAVPPVADAAQVAGRLDGCVDALTRAAEALMQGAVVEVGKTSVIYDRRRFVQVHPRPAGRSWLRSALLRWLAD